MNETKKTTDEIVLELFNKVKIKQKEIGKCEKPNWVTSCSFSYNPDSGSVNDRVNIQTVGDLKKLIDIYGFLNCKATYWEMAIIDLSMEVPFSWLGYSIEQWEKDIKSRIEQININTKKEELKTLEKRLDALISQDQRRELELAEIQKLVD